MILTKNYDDTLKPKVRNARYNPVGIITIHDTRLGGQIPLVGVKVRARRWFTYSTTYTNGDGWFQNEFFDRDVNYALFFETPSFDVRSGTFGQAWINGPNSSSPWLLNIGNDLNGFYAHVFRGAYRYHYGNIDGLRRPFFSPLKYAALDKSNQWSHAQGVNIGNWDISETNPNILIYRNKFSTGLGFASDEIFSTTVHETCHSTHMTLMNAGLVQYSQVSSSIRESWPVAVEWHITSMEYRERGISDYGRETYENILASYPLHRGYQLWNKGVRENYSSIFIDLVDDFNQNLGFADNTLPNDNVTGYSLTSIESTFLKHVYGISSLKIELKKNKPNGVTDDQIDVLLNSF